MQARLAFAKQVQESSEVCLISYHCLPKLYNNVVPNYVKHNETQCVLCAWQQLICDQF